VRRKELDDEQMIFGSVCSGIEAASAAWLPLGFTCSFMSEIDPSARAVLKHYYGDTPLHGDFTTIEAGQYAGIDILVGGTPCQSFSVAGLRGGLADARGNLALEYLRLADRLRPRWVVWENVPGVLSSAGGRDFGAFVGGLAELGYGWAYRVLDAQYFGLAQRRKRVFVVGCLGDWRRAASVLFEPASLRGDTAPRREPGERHAPTLARGSPSGGRTYGLDADTCDSLIPVAFGGNNTSGPIDIATALTAHGGPNGRCDFESETFIAFSCKDYGADAGHVAPTLRAMGAAGSHANAGGQLAVAIQGNMIGRADSAGPAGSGLSDDVSFTLTKTDIHGVMHAGGVRRLTPRECERLQGFPDDYTLIPYRGKPMAEGPRYRLLGNSMAVPVMAWIGRRIAAS
jgi:DNA (cytosine-5)-methyltransferase 1